jgi:hypothetical protein
MGKDTPHSDRIIKILARKRSQVAHMELDTSELLGHGNGTRGQFIAVRIETALACEGKKLAGARANIEERVAAGLD